MHSGGGGRWGGSVVGAPQRERASFQHLGHLKRLMPYVRRYAVVLAWGVVGLLIARLALYLIPWAQKLAIESLEDPAAEPYLVIPALLILGVVASQFAIYVPARRALRRISIASAYDLRKRFFNLVQYQGPNFFNRFGTGDLMSRAVNDISMVRMVVSFGAVNIVMFVFSVLAALGFMLAMSPALTAWVVAPLPFVAVIGFMMARGMFPFFRERQEALATLTAFTQENLNGIRTIQAMAQEKQEIERFRKASTRYAQKFYRAERYQVIVNVAMTLLTMVSPVVILLYGGLLVLDGSMSIGAFTAFFGYLILITAQVYSIGFSLSMFTSAAAATQRIFEILDYPREVVDVAEVQLPADIKGRLEFRNFTYRHPGAARPTIDGINLHVDAGETVAMLGRIGSGKSTILKAAVRLIDTPRGSVFLDGKDVCQVPIHRLREAVSMVPQDPFLFSAALRENLTYDKPDRGDDEILEAVHAAGLTETLGRLVDGLDTVVGERGTTLSGGEKQRSTLARGLIRGADVLLLDDCFSSVDTETEELILGGLQRMRAGKTTLLISHRVSTARHANRIYVIDNGRVLESGTHEELLAQGGYYADLEAVQSSQDRDRARRGQLLRQLDGARTETMPLAATGSDD
ncbi:MAG: ABC transporter ATP-binding protein [Gammaproteobacteria bacterium]|nr:ABC transporter ATP-binding protein [Gammaproteobacteria bacterium]